MKVFHIIKILLNLVLLQYTQYSLAQPTRQTKKTTKDERPFYPDPFFTVIDPNMAKHHTAHYGDYRYFDANYEYTVNNDFYLHATSERPDYDNDPAFISEIFNSRDRLQQYWKHFLYYYEPDLTPREEERYGKIFIENIKKFKGLSEDNPTASFRINEFTYLPLGEFIQMYTGFNPDASDAQDRRMEYTIGIKTYPVYLNWSAYHKYPPLKPLALQFPCPVHFMYCAMHNIEIQVLRMSKNPWIGRMSYQQGYDCSSPFKECHTRPYGAPHHVFKGLQGVGTILRMKPTETHGLEEDWQCVEHHMRAPPHRKIGKLTNYTILSVKDELELLCAVNEFGPISTGIIVSEGLKNYRSGIMSGISCDRNAQANHAVVIVGYGTDTSKVDYWILKNSWGPDWGEDGYFRLIRNEEACGIGKYLAFPNVEVFDEFKRHNEPNHDEIFFNKKGKG